MCVKIAAVTLGVCLVGCVVLPTIGDGSSKAQVTRYLEANSNVKLAEEMHPKAVERLVKLYAEGSSYRLKILLGMVRIWGDFKT